MTRLPAALGAGMAVLLAVAAVGLAAVGLAHYAISAALGACVAGLGFRVARLSERLDSLGAPRRRCGWCGELYTDRSRHRAVCEVWSTFRDEP